MRRDHDCSPTFLVQNSFQLLVSDISWYLLNAVAVLDLIIFFVLVQTSRLFMKLERYSSTPFLSCEQTKPRSNPYLNKDLTVSARIIFGCENAMIVAHELICAVHLYIQVLADYTLTKDQAWRFKLLK